jgi:hypothetical protein
MVFLLPSCKSISMQHWKAYFIFSEKEQKGILVLGLVLIISVLLHIIFPGKLKSIQQKQSLNIMTHKMFYFDPNTIDSITAYKLGLSQKQFSILENYRNKGGRFKQSTDIFKLYGLPNETAKVLLPFVSIPFTRYPNSKNEYSIKYRTDKAIWKIDINNASIDDWKQHTKMDTLLIQRILKYKNHIGFFSYQSQLQKVYGINDSIYKFLKPHLIIASPHSSTVSKNPPLLNSNTMNFEAWESLGLFQEKEIWRILRLRKTNGGRIGWKTLVLEFDLSAEQAQILREKLIIND